MGGPTTLEKEKFCRFILIKKTSSILLISFFYLIFTSNTFANFQEKFIDKYNTVNTLHFDFTQKIGEKIEVGTCYIKYPLLMKCEYPKKNKSLITNGKRLVIIKRRYKKIYHYPLKKTPLFYLLKKENIINLIKHYKPVTTNSNVVEYEFIDNNSNKLNVFFDKKKLQLSGWKTKDAYSNEVSFLIKNLEINIEVENKIFRIPKEDDL